MEQIAVQLMALNYGRTGRCGEQSEGEREGARAARGYLQLSRAASWVAREVFSGDNETARSWIATGGEQEGVRSSGDVDKNNRDLEGIGRG